MGTVVDPDHLFAEVGVMDPKLAGIIKEKLEINCLAGTETVVAELMRGIRNQLDALVTGADDGDLRTMALGLAHSLSRYKLKFSPDKVDTMIVQAICMLAWIPPER
jgi:nucleolar protein 58